MAAAFLEEKAGDSIVVLSAGSAPTGNLNPTVVAVMGEVGINIANRQPQQLTDDMAREADVVITMGCGDACPIFPGKKYLDWELTDPAGQSTEVVRGIRDEIAERVSGLKADLVG